MKTTTKQILQWLNHARINWAINRNRVPKHKEETFLVMHFGHNRAERRSLAAQISKLERFAKTPRGIGMKSKVAEHIDRLKKQYVGSLANEPHTGKVLSSREQAVIA